MQARSHQHHVFNVQGRSASSYSLFDLSGLSQAGYFKTLFGCSECAPWSYGWIFYFGAPAFMLLGWYQFFHWAIGSGVAPSLFVSFAYLQIANAIGDMAEFPKAVKTALKMLKVLCCLGPRITLRNIHC